MLRASDLHLVSPWEEWRQPTMRIRRTTAGEREWKEGTLNCRFLSGHLASLSHLLRTFFHHHQQNHTTSPYTLNQDKSSTEAVLQKHSAVHRCWPLYEKPLHGINSALLGHVAMLRGQQRWSKRKKINWQNQIEGRSACLVLGKIPLLRSA